MPCRHPGDHALGDASQDLDLAKYERALRGAGRDVIVIDRATTIEAWGLKLPPTWKQGGAGLPMPFAVRQSREELIAYACWAYARTFGRTPTVAGSEHGTRFDPAAWQALSVAGFQVVRVIIAERS